MEETKRKLSPFVFVTRWQISAADLPTEPCFAFPQGRKLYFSNRDNLYFFWPAEFHFFASTVVFLQRNDHISPITQSGQRGALETFILCTLQFSSVGRISTRAIIEYENKILKKILEYSAILILWRDDEAQKALKNKIKHIRYLILRHPTPPT